MCGIAGYIGYREATPVILDGLKRLEYRGYDSAGIAILNGEIKIYRSEGKLSQLVSKIKKGPPRGRVGIGHTRWATHGKPSENNAHPHHAGRVALVHNGIIENYLALRSTLPLKGRELKSETDTEIICHLLDSELKKTKSFLEAFRRTLNRLEGTYALVLLDQETPDKIYLAKRGSPLVIGVGEEETFVASDIPAVLPYTNKVVFLEDHELAVCGAEGYSVYNREGKPVKKNVKEIQWTAAMAEKSGYKHFMLKEIMEQPEVLANTLLGRIRKGTEQVSLGELDSLFKGKTFPPFKRFYMVACGTSWHAAMAGKYYMEAIAKIPVNVDTASEFRYREPFIDRHTLLLVISQSGETADTLACVQEAKKRGAKVVSICNVVDSSIPRSSHATLYTHAGPEIGVASTKAFTTQLEVLLMLALYFGRKSRKVDAAYMKNAVAQLLGLPVLVEKILAKKSQILRLAEEFHAAQNFYFLARGVHYPIALEGALKLKEISYIHAEGYAAGEMKHGPIALIEPGTPVVALAPQDRVCAKMIPNIEEMRARGASLIVIATEGDERFEKKFDHVFYLPPSVWYVTPILSSIPLQLLAYYTADLKGTDVDQPRNLAKSVTVE